MTEMVLDIQSLPKMIFTKVPTKKVKVTENNGTIILTPFFEEKPRFDHLTGIFSDGKMSVDKFLEKKYQELRLEL